MMKNEKSISRMARIRKTDTIPELLVRKFLFGCGIRYRLHDKTLIGKPDIVLKRDRIVVFVNGCFWHGHEGCRKNRLPKKNQEYWVPKIASNKQRDITNLNWYQEHGWSVITVWECDLDKAKIDDTLKWLIEAIRPKLNR